MLFSGHRSFRSDKGKMDAERITQASAIPPHPSVTLMKVATWP